MSSTTLPEASSALSRVIQRIRVSKSLPAKGETAPHQYQYQTCDQACLTDCTEGPG